jgi:hypothetical protein
VLFSREQTPLDRSLQDNANLTPSRRLLPGFFPEQITLDH